MYKDYLKRKEKILITAIELLDEAGINGLTTKEIANRQDITEPAIYKHFNCKKEIVSSILDSFSSFDDVIKNTIFDNDMSGKAGIRYFANAYAEYYQNYHEISTVMFSFDVFRYDDDTNSKMVSIVKGKREVLLKLVAKAIEQGELPEKTDINVIVDTVFGLIWATTFAWKMDKCKFDLKDRILKAVDALLLVRD